MTRILHPQRVSVVIPVKDDGALLRRCLRALELQTRPADEIIVVDNASHDDSAEIARSAGARVVRCEQPGIAAASAAGYDVAANEIILRLDADCVPARTWIHTMANALMDRPGVAAVTGGARFIDGPRSMRGWAAAAYLGAYVIVTWPALGHLPLFGSNLAFRRTAWQDVRHRVHRDENIHDDLDLAYHFGDRYYIRFVPSSSMGMSMRPLASVRGFARRTRRGIRTVLMHWPQEFPPLRWNRFVMRRLLLTLGVLPRSRGNT